MLLLNMTDENVQVENRGLHRFRLLLYPAWERKTTL